jgi:hypothetical protein
MNMYVTYTLRYAVFPTRAETDNYGFDPYKPGKIYFGGGTKGYNGDIWLSARPANKDLCN